MTDDLINELAALSSIYTPSTLIPISSVKDVYRLALPSRTVILRIWIPEAYPAVPPRIIRTEHIGDGLQKGYGSHVISIARSIVKRIWREGEVCLFDLIEDLESALSPAEEEGQTEGAPDLTDDEEGATTDAIGGAQHHEGGKARNGEEVEAPVWFASEVMEVKKSIFIARAAKVANPAMAKAYIAHLLATDKKVAKATHNISAYRIRSAVSSSDGHGKGGKPKAEVTFQDCDSDGEDAAGGRLLHLLQAMDEWDVLVVVSRWYGGVKLGPDRFRLINSVAREAVVRVGKRDRTGEGKKKGKE